MKKFLFAMVLSLLGAASLATAGLAETVTIYTGTKGGGYDKQAQNIAARLAQRGMEAVVENRNGSDDITLQACQNDNSMWIAQIDALYKREMKDGCYLSVVADYGDEVAMLLFPPDSDLDDLDELDSSHKVFVAKVGSGSELSFKNMQAIEKEHGRSDEWSDAEAVTGDLRRLNALANRGKVNAAFLVMKPTDNRIIKLLDTGWELGYLYDKDINDLKFGELPLYEAVKYETYKGSKTVKAWGYVVKSFIGTTEYVESDNMDAFDAMLSALE
ncbi:hypothetical protein PXK56_18415 [Phaeobacter gallaeciensis]|uniref:hypothetical protein n=1 Tax=Phaeobacter gallaeciensis TaxID=60890 RepID=UPI0023800954|nr:hypothetical protein [Phaeobacter gallaeciensis]MDE4297162.1 hypothetical protein [Phaeobacter gallaeciensis]